jgi:glycosyltransferase involved in cell wall biosynthesis
MSDSLELSVVMATYNRAETLKETIRHLSEQDLDPASFEVIVIDDGSPDNTREVVEAWMRDARFRLRYLHHSNHGPGYSQNRGLEVAEAPLVLLMADDILMSPGALSAHLAMHEAYPKLEVAVLGQVVQPPHLDKSVFLRIWDPFCFRDMRGLKELPYYRFWACNISAKRNFLIQNGMFLERRGRGGAASHEDAALGYRLSRAGLRILYCPEALAHHHHVVSLETACRRAYEQGVNFPDFRAYVGQPEIAVAYHVLGGSTLGDHFRTWFGPRRRYLLGGDRNPPALIVHYALRLALFNSFTLRFLWMPLVAWAEIEPAVARHMRPVFYRGIIACNFFKGCREAEKWPSQVEVEIEKKRG